MDHNQLLSEISRRRKPTIGGNSDWGEVLWFVAYQRAKVFDNSIRGIAHHLPQGTKRMDITGVNNWLAELTELDNIELADYENWLPGGIKITEPPIRNSRVFAALDDFYRFYTSKPDNNGTKVNSGQQWG